MKKIYAPAGPSSGLREAFVSGISTFIFLVDENEAAKLRWAGARSAPFGVAMSPKDGCAQRTGANARPKPTSFLYKFLLSLQLLYQKHTDPFSPTGRQLIN